MVISFDVTGSMMPVLATVRDNLERLTQTIFASVTPDQGSVAGAGEGSAMSASPSTRMMVFAHGDYDSRPYQVMSTPGFISDPAEVARFIRTIPSVTNGWNEGENYEEVLDRCCSLDWRPEARKLLILVGDDLPHPPHFPLNTRNLDWRAAGKMLAEMDVRVYAVQCASMEVRRAAPFYRELGRFHRLSRSIQLSQFYMMSELVLGIFHAANDDLDALALHEDSLRQRGCHSRNIGRAFAVLRGEEADPDEDEEGATPSGKRARVAAGSSRGAAAGSAPSTDPAAASHLEPVAEGRFQLMPVRSDVTIKAFVESTGARFKAGRGFYELSKPESIGPQKEIVVERRATGDMFTGQAARTLLGIAAGATSKRNPRSLGSQLQEYRVYIQSTSYNRKLIGGTMFLYELDQ